MPSLDINEVLQVDNRSCRYRSFYIYLHIVKYARTNEIDSEISFKIQNLGKN